MVNSNLPDYEMTALELGGELSLKVRADAVGIIISLPRSVSVPFINQKRSR